MARDNDFFSRTIGQADGGRDSIRVQPSGVVALIIAANYFNPVPPFRKNVTVLRY